MICHKIFQTTNSRYKRSKKHFCSSTCFGLSRIKKVRINTAGYILIYKPNHPEAIQNYILEHRYIIEQHINRPLKKNEVVHHKGIKYPIGSIENKQDNRIENLELLIKYKHDRFHSTGRNHGGHTITCYMCGKIIKRNPSQEKIGRRQVCSVECRIKLPRIKKYRKVNTGKQKYKCAICNKEIIRYKESKFVKNHYCSKKCKYSKINRNKLGQFI
jgi:hypothetical protein